MEGARYLCPMTIYAKLPSIDRASVSMTGKALRARLSDAVPVLPSADVDVEVDVTVTGNDLMTVEQTSVGTELNLFIMSEITDYGATDPKSIIAQLQSHNPDRINLYIGSVGGDVITALKIYDILRGNRAVVTAYLTGICASAATLIASAADNVVMSRQCVYMVHEASMYLGYNNKKEARQAIKLLDVSDNVIIDIYARKTGMSVEELAVLLEAETWMTADAALEMGFVDSVVEDIVLDLELPGDVKTYYDSWYFDDMDYWFAFYDKQAGAMRSEKDVFQAALFNTKKEKSTLISSRAELPVKGQTAPASVAIIPTSDMKFIDDIVAALTKTGYVKKDQSAAAVNELKASAPTLLASIVDAVKAELETAEQAPQQADPTPTPTLIEQIEAMSDEDMASLREQLGIAEEEEEVQTEEANPLAAELEALNAKVTQLTNALSAKNAGRTTASLAPPATNGTSETKSAEKPTKMDVSSQIYNFNLRAFNSGNMSAETFTSITGHAAPSRR